MSHSRTCCWCGTAGGAGSRRAGRFEAGETPREAARREFREETGLDGRLLETPAAVTVRTYREDWTPTLGLSYAAVLDGSSPLPGRAASPRRGRRCM